MIDFKITENLDRNHQPTNTLQALLYLTTERTDFVLNSCYCQSTRLHFFVLTSRQLRFHFKKISVHFVAKNFLFETKTYNS